MNQLEDNPKCLATFLRHKEGTEPASSCEANKEYSQDLNSGPLI